MKKFIYSRKSFEAFKAPQTDWKLEANTLPLLKVHVANFMFSTL